MSEERQQAFNGALQALSEEVQRLGQENARLRQENAGLRQETAETAQLRQQLAHEKDYFKRFVQFVRSQVGNVTWGKIVRFFPPGTTLPVCPAGGAATSGSAAVFMTQTPPENKNVQPGLNDGSIYMQGGIIKRAEKRKSGE